MSDPQVMLAGVPGFATARVLAQLSSGPTNSSYEIVNDGVRYVLRVDQPEAARLGLDREREAAVVAAVAEAGLAPLPVWSDAGAGMLIRPFVEGRAWSRADLDVPGNLSRLARLLRTLHAVEPVGARFDPLGAALRYAEQVGTRQARKLCLEAARAYGEIGNVKPVLCHNDLVIANVVDGERLWLIDWEYAAPGDAFFDLAVVIEHHDLAPDMAQSFFRSYLQRNPLGSETRRLDIQCRFYRSLLDIWKLRVSSPDPQPGQVE